MKNEADVDIMLLKRIQDNDSHAFEILFQKYHAPLCLFASKYTRDMDTAQEMVQNLFVYLWENRAMVHVGHSVKAYLQTAVRRNCIRYMQKRRSEVSLDELPEEGYAVEEMYDSLELKELYQQLLEAIEQLPDQCKKIFKMSRFEDMKYAEIARALQISVKTVEAQMGKALKILRKKFENQLLVLWLFLYDVKRQPIPCLVD